MLGISICVEKRIVTEYVPSVTGTFLLEKMSSNTFPASDESVDKPSGSVLIVVTESGTCVLLAIGGSFASGGIVSLSSWIVSGGEMKEKVFRMLV